VLGDSGVLAATIQFQHFPERTVLVSTGRAMTQAAGVPGTVRECLIVPTHCSSNKGTKNVRSSLLTGLVTKARRQCWLILRLPGGLGGARVCTTTQNHRMAEAGRDFWRSSYPTPCSIRAT